MKLGKMFFISLQNLFLFLRKLNFRILGIQVSERHQISKHKKKKIELLNNFRSKLMNLCPVYVILQKKKSYQKFPQFQALLSLQGIKQKLYLKMKLLKQATYIIYVLAKLSKFVQIAQ